MDEPQSLIYTVSNNECIVDEEITQADLPPGIETKISNVPFESTTWHTDKYKQNTIATSCRKFQTLYICLIREL